MMLSEYYAKMERTQTNCAPANKPQSSPTSTKQTQQMPSSSSPSSPSPSWTSNALIWTTIIALSIAGVATMVIVPLVLCAQVRQRCTGKQVPGATGARQRSSPSYSSVEAGTILTPSNLPTTPIYLPANGLKEKSGELIGSAVLVLWMETNREFILPPNNVNKTNSYQSTNQSLFVQMVNTA